VSSVIPWKRGTGTHRLADRNRRLSEENAKLLDRQVAADKFFGDLMDTNAKLHTELKATAYKLAAADDLVALQDMSLRCVNEKVAELEGQLAAQAAELNELRAFKASAQAVTVPPAVRDTSHGADQATQPVDVRTLRERFAAGPVLHLHHSPQATPPAA
jgi:hypothetical protein